MANCCYTKSLSRVRASEGTQYWWELCKVMKLKNPIIAKYVKSGNMLSKENLEF